MGQRDAVASVSSAAVVDLTAAATKVMDASLLEASQTGMRVPGATRRQRLMLEITGTALYYEGQGNASPNARSLVLELGTITGRSHWCYQRA
jgi:hypothetical protein